MYIPEGTQDSQAATHFRLAILGEAGTGKTTSALTFPNPYVIDFDHKLPAGIPSAPFWNADFVKRLVKPVSGLIPPNRRDALKIWLKNNVEEFLPEQTLILDSWTMAQHGFDEQTNFEIPNRDISDENWKFYRKKLMWSTLIADYLKRAKCNVVVIAHLQKEYDPNGNWVGKYSPLQEGKFSEAMPAFFTDFIRQLAIPEVKDPKTGVVTSTKYIWRIKPDRQFSSFVHVKTDTIEIPAKYEELERVIRKASDVGTNPAN